MKVKTSVSLSQDLVRDMDNVLGKPGLPGNRSAFLEQALRLFLATLERDERDALDLEILNRRAKKLNKEAKDVLSYQVDL